MANPNILISGGCSFTQVPGMHKNWPAFLSSKLGIPAHFCGAGSAGNDLISRRVIHRVTKCLENNIDPENILVGVMWSGVNRHGFFLREKPDDYYKITNYTNSYSYSNPNRLVKEDNFYIVNSGWNDGLSRMFLKYFYDELALYMISLEHVLRLQWFLKLRNIKYFFTTYSDDSILGLSHDGLKDSPEISYLVNQLDLDNFLDVPDMNFWNKNHSNFRFPGKQDNHPTDEMSEAFVDRVIIPHLKSKKIIS